MSRHRKAIAAGVGVALIALAEYAVQVPDVERALEAVVPAPWAQLVPVLFGGLATVAAVWRASNAPRSDAADTVPAAPASAAAVDAGTPADARAGKSVPPEPAPMPVPVAASPPDELPSTTGTGAVSVPLIVQAAQRRAEAWEAYLAQRNVEPAAHTAIVQLRPVPAPDFR